VEAGILHGREERHCIAPIETEIDLRMKMRRIPRSSSEFTRKKHTSIDICTNIKVTG